ncbi:MAG: glycerol kinase GlpK [Lachnospiraceae bacterium]|nr:glycerol kinase GlpK [Lachnospiraceae bacterium]
MSRFYILGTDQSTQGTKGVLVDDKGRIIARAYRSHRQKVNRKGWVSHDPEEIWNNVLEVLKEVIQNAGVDHSLIKALAVTNQRETTVAWDRQTGKPCADAIVWQCARASELCEEIALQEGYAELVQEKTGITLSPFFPAAKMAWLLRNEPGVKDALAKEALAMGTVDAYLVYRLTGGTQFRTDYSNASRTQLLNLHTLVWDEEICRIFDIPMAVLPEVTDSDGDFGTTDLDGFLEQPIPIRAVMGDSHGALFGHHCLESGGIKATYGTGSSVMLNIGDTFRKSSHGLATSLAWRLHGRTSYVLEGNINYTGAVITWMKEDLGLIISPEETEECARAANPADTTYLVPAFSGLGAPWWKSEAKALICGMTRLTGKNEFVRAAVESIAYQIRDVVEAMREDTGINITKLCVDGGPVKNRYLMQFQSDITNAGISIPDAEELSVLGTVYAAGLGTGLYDKTVFDALTYTFYEPVMQQQERERRVNGWRDAVGRIS